MSILSNKAIALDGCSDLLGKPNQFGDVMQRQQDIAQHFPRSHQMTKVGAAKRTAGIAGTVRIKRSEIFLKLGVF